ncbi:Uncharacterised protein [Legionella bozemanae]|uniref:Uncharacterized protein n=1 Tax=Legionella bozemanae TaxID=447 RepID=A0A0W0RIH9_LEGBO|nr:hypothetical protein Lboz_2433 [Legionella bozemanae]STO34873.1 Uncharacterised protein [Legionella bozemanae]
MEIHFLLLLYISLREIELNKITQKNKNNDMIQLHQAESSNNLMTQIKKGQKYEESKRIIRIFMRIN